MYLHHFAHKLEAKSFLEHSPANRLETPVAELYQNDLGYILISGEGLLKTLKAISWVLPHYSNINQVINFGVAGSLSPKYKVDHIYSIKNSFGQIYNNIQFQSVELEGDVDCLSTSERILTNEEADKLRPFADIIDRELYALGQITTIYKIPLKSYKIISDYAGDQTNCATIYDLGEKYSKELYHYYLKNISKEDLILKEEIELPKEFHLTDYLKKEYQKLITKNAPSPELINSIKNKKIDGKKRTQLLISELKKNNDPITAKAKCLLKDLVTPVEKLGANIYFDPILEKEEITLSMKINSQKNIEDLSHALKDISYDKILKIINGEFDV